MRKPPAQHPLTDQHGNIHYDTATKVEIFANTISTPDYTSQEEDIVTTTIQNQVNSNYIKNMFFTPGEI